MSREPAFIATRNHEYHERIVALDATPVPAPKSPYPGLHLLVNCHYDVAMADQAPSDLLDLARQDALHAIHRVAAGPDVARYVSVVVTIYGHFRCPGADRPARRRIYRLNILTEELLANSAGTVATTLSEMHAEEDSELDAVKDLLHHAVH